MNEKTRMYQKTGYLYDNNAEKINKRMRKMYRIEQNNN